MEPVCKALANNIRTITIPYQPGLELHPDVYAKDATLDIQNGFIIVDYNAGEKVFKMKIQSNTSEPAKDKSGKPVKPTYQEFEYDADSVVIMLEDIENEMFGYFGVQKRAPNMSEHDVKDIMKHRRWKG